MNPGQASATARVIAASTILLASDSRTAAEVPAGAAALCRQFLSGSLIDRMLAGSAAHAMTRKLWCWLERLTLPGIIVHWARRKRWIETCCRAAIAEGYERLIVIGAGFDTLGYRLAHEFTGLNVIEIDHPATQGAKRNALAAAAAVRNYHFIALDLSTGPLPVALPRDGKATVVVIEGVLMYLSPVDIGRLFKALYALRGDRTRIIFSFMTRWPDGGSGFRPRSWLIERWLVWRGEPFTWAIEPAAVETFIGRSHFRLIDLALAQQFGAASSRLDGENLAVCERE